MQRKYMIDEAIKLRDECCRNRVILEIQWVVLLLRRAGSDMPAFGPRCLGHTARLGREGGYERLNQVESGCRRNVITANEME